MFEMLVVLSLTGQVCYEVGPPIYINYRLCGMVEQSKFWAKTPYRDGFYRNVPIINGYAPVVTHQRCWDGSEYYTYDYGYRIRYEDVWAADIASKKALRPAPRPAPKPHLAPRPLPDPFPEPPKFIPGPDPLDQSPKKSQELPDLISQPPPKPLEIERGLRDPTTIPEPRRRIVPRYTR